MKTKTPEILPYIVYIWVPVNVKVKASSAEAAQEYALNALTSYGLQDLDTDDSRGIYLDDGCPSKLDERGPELLDADCHREYAREESMEAAIRRATRDKKRGNR